MRVEAHGLRLCDIGLMAERMELEVSPETGAVTASFSGVSGSGVRDLFGQMAAGRISMSWASLSSFMSFLESARADSMNAPEPAADPGTKERSSPAAPEPVMVPVDILERFQEVGPVSDTVYRARQRIFSEKVMSLCSDDALRAIREGPGPVVPAAESAEALVSQVLDLVTRCDDKPLSDVVVLSTGDSLVCRTRYGWKKTSVSMLFANARTVVNAYEFALLYQARARPDALVETTARLEDLYQALQALEVDGFFFAKRDCDFYASRPMKLGTAPRPGPPPRDEMDDQLMDFAHSAWARVATRAGLKKVQQHRAAFIRSIVRTVQRNAEAASARVAREFVY